MRCCISLIYNSKFLSPCSGFIECIHWVNPLDECGVDYGKLTLGEKHASLGLKWQQNEGSGLGYVKYRMPI